MSESFPASDEAIIKAVRRVATLRENGGTYKWALFQSVQKLLPDEPDLLERLESMAAHGVFCRKYDWKNHAPLGRVGTHPIVGFDPEKVFFRVL